MRQRASRSLPGAVLCALLATVLAACGGSPEGSDGPAGEIDRDATLRATWVIPAMPLDPHTATSETGQFPYISLVYDRLTQMVGGENGAELAPMVAESWEFGPDGRTLTLHLRDDVTFADGSALDAAAVKASLDRALTHPESTAKNTLSMIEQVAAPDPRTVVITADRPAADLPYLLSTGAGSIINPRALDKPDLDVAPEGSGPYVVTEVKLGDGVVYERREGYWDPEAGKAERIEIRGVPDPNARINGIRGDQADLTVLQPQQHDIASSLGEDYTMHVYRQAGQWQPVRLNTNRPHLSDVRVRQALNFAINRDAINEALLDGQNPAVDQPLSEMYPGHLTDPPVAYRYDPAQARELLAQAGLADGFSMTMLVPSYSPATELGMAVQAQLAEVGVEVRIESMDPIQALQQWKPDSEYDAFMQVRVGYETAAMTLSRNYLIPTAFVGPVPPEFSEAVRGAFDPSISEQERTRMLETASAIANKQAFEIYLNKVHSLILTTDEVTGADTMGRADYQGIFDLRYVGITR